MKSLPIDTSWNNVKAVLYQHFCLVPAITHASTCLMSQYQQKGESWLEFNFEFSELILTVSNHEPKEFTDPVKIYMYVQKLFNPAISSKTIIHAHPTI